MKLDFCAFPMTEPPSRAIPIFASFVLTVYLSFFKDYISLHLKNQCFTNCTKNSDVFGESLCY